MNSSDIDAERELFEYAAYAHYLRRRAARAAAGAPPALHDPEHSPVPRDELFQRTPAGDYISLAYQSAWGGWRMAKGLL